MCLIFIFYLKKQYTFHVNPSIDFKICNMIVVIIIKRVIIIYLVDVLLNNSKNGLKIVKKNPIIIEMKNLGNLN